YGVEVRPRGPLPQPSDVGQPPGPVGDHAGAAIDYRRCLSADDDTSRHGPAYGDPSAGLVRRCEGLPRRPGQPERHDGPVPGPDPDIRGPGAGYAVLGR